MARTRSPYAVSVRYPTKHGKRDPIYYVRFWDYVNRKYETAIPTGMSRKRDAII